jgi:hypothetical protein
MTDLRPLRDAPDASVARQRFVTLVLATFSGLALLLAGIGVLGVMSNLLARDSGDFGIQLALSASPVRFSAGRFFTGIVPAHTGPRLPTRCPLRAD